MKCGKVSTEAVKNLGQNLVGCKAGVISLPVRDLLPPSFHTRSFHLCIQNPLYR